MGTMKMLLFFYKAGNWRRGATIRLEAFKTPVLP
jgi:hypothetical protein